MTKDQVFEFFRRLAEDNPAPETELEFGNAFQLVVAVALSALMVGVQIGSHELACTGHDGLIRYWTC